jgi:hypothetical protein
VWAPALAGGFAAAVAAGPAAGAITALVAGAAAAPLVRDRTGRAGSLDDLESQLARCRRRGERAWVLVARVDASGADVAHVRALLRLSDAVVAVRAIDRVDLCAVIDGDVDREALEERLRRSLPGRLRCGWAVFPDEALTLEMLMAAARKDSASIAAATNPVPALPRRSAS